MEWIVGAIAVYCVWKITSWLLSLFSSKPTLRTSNKRAVKKLEENMSWLEVRWDEADTTPDGEKPTTVPDWFFEPATNRQIEKLEELGIQVRSKDLNKGRASDLIGLFYPYDDEDREKLKHFKIPLKGLNQSKARHELAKIPQATMRQEGWKDRPASVLDREYLKFFKLSIPKGLTKRQAADLRDQHQSDLPDDQQSRLDDWEHFESLYEDFQDREFRNDYELRAIGLKDFKAATLALLKEGNKFQDLGSDMVAEKLVELNPALEKSS